MSVVCEKDSLLITELVNDTSNHEIITSQLYPSEHGQKVPIRQPPPHTSNRDDAHQSPPIRRRPPSCTNQTGVPISLVLILCEPLTAVNRKGNVSIYFSRRQNGNRFHQSETDCISWMGVWECRVWHTSSPWHIGECEGQVCHLLLWCPLSLSWSGATISLWRIFFFFFLRWLRKEVLTYQSPPERKFWWARNQNGRWEYEQSLANPKLAKHVIAIDNYEKEHVMYWGIPPFPIVTEI